MPTLIRKKYYGPEQKEWVLKGNAVTVGRGEQADIRIDDPEMSRRHFRISYQDGHYVMDDLDSHNGTLVGRKRVTSLVLPETCMIRAGQTVFEFTPGATSFIQKAVDGGPGYGSHVRKLKQQERR